MCISINIANVYLHDAFFSKVKYNSKVLAAKNNVLLERMIFINCRKSKTIIIMAVVFIGMLSSCSCIIPLGEESTDSDLNLYDSIECDNVEEAIEAIQNGANINQLSGNLYEKTDNCTKEKNPFRIACFLSNYNVAKTLIQNGADVNYKDADGNPILFYTIGTHNKSLCEYLISYGANINEPAKNGYTALGYALYVKNGDIYDGLKSEKIINLLLEHGAKLTQKSFKLGLSGISDVGYCNYKLTQETLKKLLQSKQKSGLSATLEAAILGNSSKVEEYVKSNIHNADDHKVLFYTAAFGTASTLDCLLKNGQSINECDDVNNNLLSIAAQTGNLQVINYLLEHGLNINEAQGDISLSPLENAVASNQYETAKLLLNKGAKIKASATNKDDYADGDVLINASKNGNVSMVKLLFDNGYPKISDNITLAMESAAENNQTELLQYYLSLGYSANSKYADDCLLDAVCQTGNLSIVKLLIENGADVNGSKTKGKPLYNACHNGDVETVKYLIKNGADVNLSVIYTDGSYAGTALWDATDNGNFDIVKLLVKHGANINYSKDGNTALYYASEVSESKILEYLLQKGANIDAQDSNGDTAIIRSAKRGLVDNVKVLLKYKANLNIKDKKGYTVFTISKSRNKDRINKLISLEN